MQRLRFDCTVNPFGILFNPQSVLQALARLAEFRPFEAGELQETPGGAYCSWMHHGRFAAPCPDEALRLMNSEYRPAAERFAHLRTLLLTWGTSYLYILRSSGEVVANCHKFPASLFLRRRMEEGKHLHLEVTDAACDVILDAAYDSVYGARPIKRFIQSRVETAVAKAIIRGDFAEGATLTVDWDGSGFTLR